MGLETANHFSAVVQSLEEPPLQINLAALPDSSDTKPLGFSTSAFARDWWILHIEDDDGDAYLILRALRQAAIPASVYRCLDAEEGLFFLRRNSSDEARLPDVVLLDLNTPRMNGWEFLTAVNTDKALRGLHVVIVTSSSLPEDRERAVELGAKGFQTKPDHFDELIKMVEKIFTAPLKEQLGSRWKDPALTAVRA